MTENQNVGEGAAEQPAPQVSQPIEGDVTKMLADFGGKLEGISKELRGLQGRQDKADNKYSDFQGQLARLNQYKAQGLNDTEALAEMEADDVAANRWKSIEEKIEGLAARIGGVGTQPDTQQMVAAVLSEYNLDPKDAYVAGRLSGQKFETKEQAELFAARILRDIVTNKTNPAQQSASTGVVTGASDPSADFLRLEGLYKNYSQNAGEIQAIEGRLKASGAMK